MATTAAARTRPRFAGYGPTGPALNYLQSLVDSRDWAADPDLAGRVATLVEQIKVGTLDAAVCSRAIDRLKPLPRKASPNAGKGAPDVSSGFYALGTAEVPRRYRVKVTEHGRVYVDFIGPNDAREYLRFGEAMKVLAQIAVNPDAAAQLYAEVTDRCAACNRLLTVPASVHRGYGPDCAKARGLV